MMNMNKKSLLLLASKVIFGIGLAVYIEKITKHSYECGKLDGCEEAALDCDLDYRDETIMELSETNRTLQNKYNRLLKALADTTPSSANLESEMQSAFNKIEEEI